MTHDSRPLDKNRGAPKLTEGATVYEGEVIVYNFKTKQGDRATRHNRNEPGILLRREDQAGGTENPFRRKWPLYHLRCRCAPLLFRIAEDEGHGRPNFRSAGHPVCGGRPYFCIAVRCISKPTKAAGTQESFHRVIRRMATAAMDLHISATTKSSMTISTPADKQIFIPSADTMLIFWPNTISAICSMAQQQSNMGSVKRDFQAAMVTPKIGSRAGTFQISYWAMKLLSRRTLVLRMINIFKTTPRVAAIFDRQVTSSASFQTGWSDAGVSLGIDYQRSQNLNDGTYQESSPQINFSKTTWFPFQSTDGTQPSTLSTALGLSSIGIGYNFSASHSLAHNTNTPNYETDSTVYTNVENYSMLDIPSISMVAEDRIFYDHSPRIGR